MIPTGQGGANQELSGLEASVLAGLSGGKPMFEIAESHDLTEFTIVLLAKQIAKKLGARNIRDAISVKMAVDKSVL